MRRFKNGKKKHSNKIKFYNRQIRIRMKAFHLKNIIINYFFKMINDTFRFFDFLSGG